MEIKSSIAVDAPPDEVFAYLLDVNQVVGCVPGAELGEVVDSQTFRGKLKIKVGAVSIVYQGSAHIVDTDVRRPGHDREVGGQGRVKANVALTVARVVVRSCSGRRRWWTWREAASATRNALMRPNVRSPTVEV